VYSWVDVEIRFKEYTIAALRELESEMPSLGGFPSRCLAETYEDFIEVLYKDIDQIILLKQENPEMYRTDPGEDRLTVEIKNALVCKGYNATHETKHGGHTDLLVRRKSYIWIGEAKVHKSYPYLFKGFNQLISRYSTGDFNQQDGGILIYIFKKDSQSIMNKWKDYLLSKNPKDCSCVPCEPRRLGFYSTHTHEKSGLPFRIRHMPLMLYFNPKDRVSANLNAP